MQSHILRTAILANPCALEGDGIVIDFADYELATVESDLSKIADGTIAIPMLSIASVGDLIDIIESGVSTYTIVANSSATAVTLAYISEELQLLMQFIGSSYKMFLAGVAISEGTQMFVNYAYYGDWEDSWDNIDQFDAIADGMLFSITMSIGNATNMLKNGYRIAFCKSNLQTNRVITIEFTKATFDFKAESSELQSVFNGKKESFDVFCDFLFSIVGTKFSDGIQAHLIQWSNTDIKNLYSTFTPERKALADQIDAIVKSDGFKEAINIPTSALNKFIEEFTKKNLSVCFEKVREEEISYTFDSYIQNQYSEPMDNTQVEILVVKPIDNSQIKTIITEQ